MNKIINERNIPEGWSNGFIVNFYKGKGLRLVDHVMKVLERALEILIRSQVDFKKDLGSLVYWARVRKQQQNAKWSCRECRKELVLIGYFARVVNSGSITRSRVEGLLKKESFNAVSVKVKASPPTVWIVPKCTSGETRLKLFQLFDISVMWLENWTHYWIVVWC